MSKDPFVYVAHVQESIDMLQQYFDGVTKAAFMKNKQLEDAAVRRIEIIGEAVKQLPSAFRNARPSIRWSNIARMRDKLIHRYFGVSLDAVWDVVKHDLPILKKQLKEAG